MKLFLAEEMHKVDAKAINKVKMPELVLMENAGRCIAEAVEDYLDGAQGSQIVVLAGKGNNGGDGLVAARLLSKAGALVTVVLAQQPKNFSASALTEYQILEHCMVESICWSKDEEMRDSIIQLCSQADVVVDALLGTGFKGELKGSYREIIAAMPEDLPVIAVDIPSGVEADTGRVAAALPALFTVTMIAPKLGLYLYPGAAYSGNILVADLGTPGILVEEAPCKNFLLEEDLIQGLLPKRAVTAHKGNNGRIALLAGGNGYVGAAELASKAAVRAGGGLVHLYTALQAVNILATKLTEVMVEAMPAPSVAEALSATLTLDALGAGPGLGKAPEVQQFVRDFLWEAGMPKVIDADGLNAFQGHDSQLKQVGNKIMTPHPAELARLLKVDTSAIIEAPLDYARLAAKKYQSVVLLKTVPALVATPQGQIYVNTTGNEGMATGGCGDVLTGVITAFLGQGLALTEAAICGMYIHGLAGDLAAVKGKIGMRAGDLLDYLPQAINMVLEGRDIELQ